MPDRTLTKVVDIGDLQPTQFILKRNILEKIAEGSHFPNHEIEIWSFEGLLLIAEGHHRIYDALMNGAKYIKARCHTTKDSLMNTAGYTYAVDELLKGAEACRESGIFNVSHLILQ